MFSVNEATEADVPVIRDIAEKTWWPSYRTILLPAQIRYMLDVLYADQTIRRQITNQTQCYLLLSDHGAVQGFAAFSRWTEEVGLGKLHKLYVLPDNQGKGYGKGLIEAVKDRLSVCGIRTLDLNVNRYNPARAFYERMGFRVIREEDIPIGPYWMNDYVMRLNF